MSAEHAPQLIVVDRNGGTPPPRSAHTYAGPERRFPVRELLEVLTAVALVVYGAVHFGDYAFYARLGVSPDAVGLDYGRTLSAVAVGLALFVAALALLLTAGALIGSRDAGNPAVRVGAALAAGVGGMLLLLALLPPLPRYTVQVGAVAIAIAGGVLDASFEQLRARASRLGGRAMLAIAAPVIVLAFGFAGLAGYHAAGFVLDGEDLPCGCTHFLGRNVTLPWVSGSRGFMGIEAENASVEWVGAADRGRPLPAHPIYLGTADGMVVLYDSDLDRAVRIPAQSVTVQTEPKVISWR